MVELRTGSHSCEVAIYEDTEVGMTSRRALTLGSRGHSPASDDAKALALGVKEQSAPLHGNLALMDLLDLGVA